MAFPSGTSRYARMSLDHGAVLIATVVRTTWPTRAGPCLAHSSRETLGRTKEKNGRMRSSRVPHPLFPPPFTHPHPLPPDLENSIHAGLARPLWRLGQGGLCAVRVQRKKGGAHTPLSTGFLEGARATSVFCTFRKTKALCSALAGAYTLPRSRVPARKPKLAGLAGPVVAAEDGAQQRPANMPSRPSQ